MTAQNAVHVEDQKINGVDTGKILNLVASIEEDKDNANFQFRVNNNWVEGGLNRSYIQDFYANGREDDTRNQPFIVDSDEPEIAAGGNSAPNPMEYVLHSLAGCLTSTMVNHAAVQGIEIESAQTSLEGDMDVRGMLGLSDEARKAYNKVRVLMRVKSTASADTLKELALYSPVFDIISNSLPVEFELEKI